MSKIANVAALKILDSRGDWTVEVKVTLDDGSVGVSSVPAGASVGKYEARTRPAEEVVKKINEEMGRKFLGEDSANQRELDAYLIKLDGTPNKSRLGGNLTLALSEAFAAAAAKSLKVPLFRYIDSLFEPEEENFFMPTPIFNLINGGQHARNDLDFQEFLFVPLTAVGFRTKLEWGVKVYHTLESTLSLKGYSTQLGDEGGFAPQNVRNEEAIALLEEVVQTCDLTLGEERVLGCDVAAASFFRDGYYHLKGAGAVLDPREMRNLYAQLIRENRLVYLEDSFAEDSFEDWRYLTANFGEKVEIVGDDLVATNLERLKMAVEKDAITGVIIKPNQVGTLSETLAVVEEAKKAGLTIIASHRSGETESTFIADFAVGIGAKYLKAGAPARGERVAKYDRLLEIEGEV